MKKTILSQFLSFLGAEPSYVTAPGYSVSPVAGVNFNNVEDSDAPAHTVGTIVLGTDGSKWIYVQALSTIAQYDAVAIITSGSAVNANMGAVPITTTNALTSVRVGLAQVAIASSKYGWVALEGNNLRVKALISCQPAVPMFTTATAGSLDDAIVTAGHVLGVVLKSSATSASAPPCIAAHPHIGIYGGG